MRPFKIPLPYFIFLISSCSFSLTSSAQEFGGNPPSLKWKQINTDTVRVIFPYGQEERAQRAASFIHAMARDSVSALGKKLFKVDVVLQNQTTISNGYVGLGPFRSEFYLTPSLNNFELGSLNWADALTIHEYRHVQQFNNFRNGASKLMGTLFGEEWLAVAINASIPDWFYEGDAVYNETRLSLQGRGRLPLFLNQYPALWNEGKKYSWMKLRNGSLKDFVPSHYPLGYLMVNYGRTKYGPSFWSKVTKEASAFKGLFYPFQKAIKVHAGVDYKTFTRQAFDFYKEIQATVPEQGQVNVLPVNKKYLQNDLFPYQAGDDSLIFLRTTYRHRPAFYVHQVGIPRKIRARDISLDDQFSYRNGKIVYAAYQPAVRWGWRDYSELRVLDIQTGKQKVLTKRTKYFTPDISPDGATVVAVQMTPEGTNALHLLSAIDGKLIRELPNTGHYIFTDPKFINDDQLVSAVRLPDGRMALGRVTLSTGDLDWVTPPTYSVIGYPQVNNDQVYFTASYQGNDDVFSVSLESKEISIITQGGGGYYFVNAKEDSVVYSRFTAEGYRLVKQHLGEKSKPYFLQEDQLPLLRFPVAGTLDRRTGFLQETPATRFSETKYKQATRLLNFHSWRPYYEDPEFRFSLYGNNVLNTLESEWYYLYNQNEKTHALGITETFGGWFPYLSVGTQLTFARQDSVNSQLRQWNQLDTRIGFNIPLNLTSGRMFKFLNFGTNYFLRNEFNTGPNKNNFTTNSFTYLQHFISWSQQVQQARQHIFPRFGYNAQVQHRHAVTKFEGYQFLANGNIYLPGLLQNHSIVLSGIFQQRDTSRALFANRLAGARGFTDYYFSRMWKISVNYHLPLLLPDWGIGNIVYIQRVRGNGFYDLQRVFSNNKLLSRDLRSTGAEFFFDTKWWNQYELTFGFRINHLLEDDLLLQRRAGDNWFEIILPVAIIPR
ncbi:MAG: hypothetical protein B7Z54_02475 [Sphingobacteriales bacterium 12-47-4]|nr:MAG: hypothetical protein B7Z54_02475 [Sphingobacteriales bacterium 12-47-4]